MSRFFLVGFFGLGFACEVPDSLVVQPLDCMAGQVLSPTGETEEDYFIYAPGTGHEFGRFALGNSCDQKVVLDSLVVEVSDSFDLWSIDREHENPVSAVTLIEEIGDGRIVGTAQVFDLVDEEGELRHLAIFESMNVTMIENGIKLFRIVTEETKCVAPPDPLPSEEIPAVPAAMVTVPLGGLSVSIDGGAPQMSDIRFIPGVLYFFPSGEKPGAFPRPPPSFSFGVTP